MYGLTPPKAFPALPPPAQVVEAKCMTRGGVGRGFGFVTFAEVPDPSLLLGGVVVNGNVVSVKEALPDPAVVPPGVPLKGAGALCGV